MYGDKYANYPEKDFKGLNENKDVVFIIAVKKDGQLKPEYEIGIESWRRWCKKNDVELFLLEEPVLPMEDMHIIFKDISCLIFMTQMRLKQIKP